VGHRMEWWLTGHIRGGGDEEWKVRSGKPGPLGNTECGERTIWLEGKWDLSQNSVKVRGTKMSKGAFGVLHT